MADRLIKELVPLATKKFKTPIKGYGYIYLYMYIGVFNCKEKLHF